MPNTIIITNNPAVVESYPNLSQYYNVNVHGIFLTVRDEIHKGVQLISHPLSGSIKPWETPYKSVVISAIKGKLDFKSLQIIEDAINVLKRSKQIKHNYSKKILDDFSIIDLDLVNSALQSNTFI